MKFRENCRYALLVPTSMGVRLTPVDRQPVYCSDRFFMQATSAETNTASVLSYLGLKVKVLTRFVKDSPIAQFIRYNLQSRGFDIDAPEVMQEGPWGYRHQFNIADMGFGPRGPRVYNDRAGEVGATLNASDYNLKQIFENEGVKILHLSGLIAAISDQTAAFCLEIIEIARKNGTLISFDMNYRPSFWYNREAELHHTFVRIVEQTNFLFAGTDDFVKCLHVNLPAIENNITERIRIYKHAVEKLRESYPQVNIFATSLRETLSANNHLWGALMFDQTNWFEIDPRSIEVLDRIGGGDAFVGGILYGLIRGWEHEKALQFGWACGAMAVTLTTDYLQPLNEEQIWNLWAGNARVIR
ncbi:MAG: sugar kinase [Bacteroidales bacterium]|nr:sugar kinase [Bacteroidales bacterium]